MNVISTLSNEPFVFIHSDQIYHSLNNLLLNKLSNIKSSPFEFKNNLGELFKEKYRFNYPVSEIFADEKISLVIKDFAKIVVPKFISALRAEINEDGYYLSDKEKLKYCLRIRVFEDKECYSLHPHKDSEDTIFSFILQLDSNNTRTAIYNEVRKFKLTGDFSNDSSEMINQVTSVINKLCPGEEIFISESQFNKNFGLWTDKKCYVFEKISDRIIIQELNETVLDVKNNCIYGISNSRVKCINSSKLKKANQTNYHGVRPIKQESRKLLVMDLIAQPTSGDTLVLAGVNTDIHSYYLIYRPENCGELTRLLS